MVKHDISVVSAISGSPEIKGVAGIQGSYTSIRPEQSSVELSIYKAQAL